MVVVVFFVSAGFYKMLSGEQLYPKAKNSKAKQQSRRRNAKSTPFKCWFRNPLSMFSISLGETLTCAWRMVWIDIVKHALYVKSHNRLWCPSFKIIALALMYMLVLFHAVKWDAVALITVTSRGFEELQQETLADLSSPALWNCRAVPLQSRIIAESVAKEPVAHAFIWKCRRKSE